MVDTAPAKLGKEIDPADENDDILIPEGGPLYD